MSIPLDQIYNFLDSVNNSDIIIYRFSPHGSKKITDLSQLHHYLPTTFGKHYLICHDQEPLNFLDYSRTETVEQLFAGFFSITTADVDKLNRLKLIYANRNIRMINLNMHINKNCFLLHSEKNSNELKAYEESGLIGVYWWSHAVIARDWFRFALHDPALLKKNILKDFLVYNRAWSGSREYRLKFAEMIVEKGLVDHCAMTFNPTDCNIDYHDHIYKNTAFKVHTVLQDHFALNTFDSTASADYVSQDYISTGIEVVLETLFDDARWHLTEKILRPIACGQPFMLAGTMGELEYLRDYGFRTFDGLIDETYNTVSDPIERLEVLTAEMKRIAMLQPDEKIQLFKDLQKIADHNKSLFFSKEWHDNIIDEFKTNLAHARKHGS